MEAKKGGRIMTKVKEICKCDAFRNVVEVKKANVISLLTRDDLLL